MDGHFRPLSISNTEALCKSLLPLQGHFCARQRTHVGVYSLKLPVSLANIISVSREERPNALVHCFIHDTFISPSVQKRCFLKVTRQTSGPEECSVFIICNFNGGGCMCLWGTCVVHPAAYENLYHLPHFQYLS